MTATPTAAHLAAFVDAMRTARRLHSIVADAEIAAELPAAFERNGWRLVPVDGGDTPVDARAFSRWFLAQPVQHRRAFLKSLGPDYEDLVPAGATAPDSAAFERGWECGKEFAILHGRLVHGCDHGGLPAETADDWSLRLHADAPPLDAERLATGVNHVITALTTWALPPNRTEVVILLRRALGVNDEDSPNALRATPPAVRQEAEEAD